MSGVIDTVRVRIPVAVGLKKDGSPTWNASGWPDAHASRDTAIDGLDPEVGTYEVHWIEATIPVPRSVTVEGNAVPESPEERQRYGGEG